MDLSYFKIQTIKFLHIIMLSTSKTTEIWPKIILKIGLVGIHNTIIHENKFNLALK